ncbi:MspA family porin [Nocardia bovistercoris]|uniref:MspA family porin n=1 Tax=Nocardia bovistercoris TaxID=2785916 RepID=A0A931IFT6_9NOCA|nr:MspA family porin [Nocardia bovistercoris]MBH0780744.1 MspA family porin [Nocardia bovistercoris]
MLGRAKAPVVGAVAAVAIGMLSVGAAHADTFTALPGGWVEQTLADGSVVTVRLEGESVDVSPSLGATPLHRNAWVSGSARVEIAGPAAGFLTKMVPGYKVGCQVDISGGGTGAGLSGAAFGDGAGGLHGIVRGDGGANLRLGPGETRMFFILDRELPGRYGDESHLPLHYFKGESGSVTWSDSTIALNGCAGAAQARAFVTVLVDSETANSRITLWGQPFSLG